MSGADRDHLSEALEKGASAMVAAQADPEPQIVHTLKVLLDPEGWAPAHVKWVKEGAREILKNWNQGGKLPQLKRDLGLEVSKARSGRPRSTAAVRREIEIADAIISAALDGDSKPKRAAATKLDESLRNVQRAWRRFALVHIARLELDASQCSEGDRQKIRAAIDRLKGRDTK